MTSTALGYVTSIHETALDKENNRLQPLSIEQMTSYLSGPQCYI